MIIIMTNDYSVYTTYKNGKFMTGHGKLMGMLVCIAH